MSEIRYEDRPWLKNYVPGVPTSIDYQEICIPHMLENTAEKFPDQTALIFQGYFVTYQELKDMVDRFACCLADFGVQKDDKVAVLLPNCIHAVVAYYATLKLGAVVVMNNPLYTDRELEYQYNDSGSKVLICMDWLTERMVALRPSTGIKQIVSASLADYLSPENVGKIPAAPLVDAENVFDFKWCLEKYPPDPPRVDINWNDTAVLQYTGGTTGLPKAAILTHRNLSSMIQMYRAWIYDVVPGEGTLLAATPIFHILGMQVAMNLPIYMGMRNVLIPKPTPDTLLEAIRLYRPNFSPLVPTHYIGMLQHPDLAKTDLTCFKGLFSGGASLPVEVLHRFEEISGAIICEGFGMSETSPQTHLNPYGEGGGPRKPGSIGVGWIDTEIRVVDLETGQDAPIGQPGEMWFRGPQVTSGYYGKPEETAQAITEDGWLKSGDIVYMDEDGYFFVVDRKKDMIISSGYNIYPREIEEVFYQHPKVNKVAAIGIPDEKRGENVGVYISLKPGETATPEEFMEFCKPKLAKYKWPTVIEIWDELPESNIGKLLKRALRDMVLEKIAASLD
ncbi:MAG: long-chain-fatty-acid--CoA ligase [Syntrophomonadaceae bacterium]|nr:long-chain fatty acid--CoA ligase [Bacillota bacterium]